jgi:outer membrane protein insertion porin family
MAINATGSKRFTAEDISAATGLQMGSDADEPDFKAAARRLVESGAFSDVGFQFAYAKTGTTLDWQLTDAPKFVPAEFDNFIWLPRAALLDELRKRLPLFKGDLPLSGTLPDEVSDTLQGMLDELAVKGRIDYLRFAPKGTENISAFRYTVTDVSIHIRQFEFPGALPDDIPLLNRAAEQLVGDNYSEFKVAANAKLNLLPVYLQRGYLKVKFGEPEAKLVDPKASDLEVDVSLPVEPGHAYSVERVRWSGNKAFPTERLSELLHLQPDKPSNAVRLESDVRAVVRLYGTRGYMRANVQPIPQFDDDKQTVSYELKVQEGNVYRMGELDLQGPDSRATQELSAAWKLRPGEPYDSSYPAQFLKDTEKLLPTNLRYEPSFHETLEDTDKTVDVTIRYAGHPN